MMDLEQFKYKKSVPSNLLRPQPLALVQAYKADIVKADVVKADVGNDADEEKEAEEESEAEAKEEEDAEKEIEADEEEEYVQTDEHRNVISAFQNKENILITGPAGTGKSKLVHKICALCPNSLLCGFTGTAALQLFPDGQTIHSLLQLPIDFPDEEHLRKRYARLAQDNKPWIDRIRRATVIIVDEVSMISAYMMVAMNIALCQLRGICYEPWGGLQVVFVGDFLQIAPIYNIKDGPPKTQEQHAFESNVWKELNVQVYSLTRIFRQADSEFASLLSAIRINGVLSDEHQELLGTMCYRIAPDTALHIMHTKDDVARHNLRKREDLTSANVHFAFPEASMKVNVDQYKSLYENVCSSLHLKETSTRQTFKVGMRVMITRNMVLCGLRCVNGDVGTIVKFVKGDDSGKEYPLVHIKRFSQPIVILSTKWEKKQSMFVGGKVQDCIVAMIEAIPLIPAWAITAHKSQGATISEDIYINGHNMNWIPGIFYVALSRAKRSSQISLQKYKGHTASKEGLMFYETTSLMAMDTTEECVSAIKPDDYSNTQNTQNTQISAKDAEKNIRSVLDALILEYGRNNTFLQTILKEYIL